MSVLETNYGNALPGPQDGYLMPHRDLFAQFVRAAKATPDILAFAVLGNWNEDRNDCSPALCAMFLTDWGVFGARQGIIKQGANPDWGALIGVYRPDGPEPNPADLVLVGQLEGAGVHVGDYLIVGRETYLSAFDALMPGSWCDLCQRRVIPQPHEFQNGCGSYEAGHAQGCPKLNQDAA